MNTFSSLFQSFSYALRGLKFVYSHEKNFRRECFFAFLVFISLFILPFSRFEVILLIFLCGFVLMLEMVNSIGEHFLDLIKPRLSYQVQTLKDLLAGAVLISVFLSVIVGCLIYIPVLIEYLGQFMVQYPN